MAVDRGYPQVCRHGVVCCAPEALEYASMMPGGYPCSFAAAQLFSERTCRFSAAFSCSMIHRIQDALLQLEAEMVGEYGNEAERIWQAKRQAVDMETAAGP